MPQQIRISLTAGSGEFNIDDIQEANWNDAAFDNLVLPEGEKQLTLAFTDRTRLNNKHFDDFVQHKGNITSPLNRKRAYPDS